MTYRIEKVAVLGAGVMGSGIAAHLANAGIRCLLLDIVPPGEPQGDASDPSWRNRFALGAIERMKKAKPSPIFTRAALAFIEPGNFEDDLGRIAECDLVVEAVKEDLDIKRSLFARVDELRSEHTIVASNTSGLSLAAMAEGRSESFRRHFLVTHFFNPVRYMKLLELVAGPDTDPAVVEAAHRFGEEVLGKGIVYAKDTPNFIANRIGVYGMMKTMAVMREMGLTVEEVDAIFGPAMGRPKSAVFRTADLVGLDTFVHVARNCYDNLPDDEEREIFQIPDFLEKMVERGWLGRKSGQGFYKKVKGPDGKSQIYYLDLDTFEYKPATKPRFESIGKARKARTAAQKVAAVLGGSDKAAAFARAVTLPVLAYASRRIPEIADTLYDVDRAMRWGFNWELGPFETWDALGAADGVEQMKAAGVEPATWVAEMLGRGRTRFYSVEGVEDRCWDPLHAKEVTVPTHPRALRVEVLRRGERKVDGNRGATLWDMDDGVLLVEFHTKMNSIDDAVIAMLDRALDVAQRDFRAIVIGNDGEHFSAGANIMALLMAAKMKQFDAIEKLVDSFQTVNQRLHYSRVPVVTAPHGLTLGGGAEVTMAGNAVQAAAETYMGLVEVGVGLIPGGGGTVALLRNVYGAVAADKDFAPEPYIKKVFQMIAMAKVATSGEEAQEFGFLRPTDAISLNGDFLLHDAKQRAIGLAESGWRPPRPTRFLLPGRSGRATIEMLLYNLEQDRQISAHDRLIATKLATVLTGGDTAPHVPVTEERLLELEREAFLSLCGEEKTHARLAYMLEHGKPLRN